MKVYIVRHDLTPADEAAMWVNEAIFTSKRLADEYVSKRPGYKVEAHELRGKHGLRSVQG